MRLHCRGLEVMFFSKITVTSMLWQITVTAFCNIYRYSIDTTNIFPGTSYLYKRITERMKWDKHVTHTGLSNAYEHFTRKTWRKDSTWNYPSNFWQRKLLHRISMNTGVGEHITVWLLPLYAIFLSQSVTVVAINNRLKWYFEAFQSN